MSKGGSSVQKISDIELNMIYQPLLRRQPQRRLRRWLTDHTAPQRVEREGGFDITIRCLPGISISGVSGKRIVFLSDLHYHCRAVDERRLRRLEGILRRLKPDLLLLGGDMVTDACLLAAVPEVLRRLSSLAPRTFAVPGNWEQGKSWMNNGQWMDIYRSGSVELLCNCHISGSWFDLYGTEDPAAGYPLQQSGWEQGKLRILLAHRPDVLVAFSEPRNTFHLGLAGHNHGGQIVLPFVGPLYVPGYCGRRFAAGSFVHRKSGSRIIVSRGLGECSLPWRFNCRREVVVVDFE